MASLYRLTFLEGSLAASMHVRQALLEQTDTLEPPALTVTDELRACARESCEPYENIHRINDMGEYVSEDWESTLADRSIW